VRQAPGGTPRTLFVSDLHLDAARPRVTRLFLDFLETHARHTDALYLLGDLFETWIGDDDDNPVGSAVMDGLRICVDSGTPVHLMHGNRDFLLGARFAARTGCRLLDDPARIDLYGSPALLMHGDTLCTDDLEYQAFRTRVRDHRWQQGFLRQSLQARRITARQLRRLSRAGASEKPELTGDVDHKAVVQAMTRHGVLHLIHGHTHRPAIHEFELAGRPARRMVLGAWDDHGSVLECTPTGCRLRDLRPD
jgi:UDP-2,3-diacylglucosamine hydrolase